MTDQRTHSPRTDLWSSPAGFILAATGAAVGLGNVWRFPYITGENGGGAFVLVYLACVCLIGVPLMMAEFFIGRRGASSPDECFRVLALESGRSHRWRIVGTLGVAVSFLILTFYSVIGGWTVAFLVRSVGPGFDGLTGAESKQQFELFMTSPREMIFWHTVFMLISAAVVLRGVAHGIERLATYLMPCLLLILLVLLAYSTTTPGFGHGVSFMFSFEYSRLTTGGVVIALGHAFFSLALAQSVIVAFGSHLPRSISLTQASFTISMLDTLVALIVGVVIFSIVFSSGLEISSGPGLIFQSLPVAFGKMPYGHAFGIAFFVMLVLAAWTSSVGLLVPPIEQLEVRYGMSRSRGTALVAVTAWLIGILCALSFGTLADFRPIGGKTIYGMIDYLTSGIMMPVTGLLIAVFAGWIVSASAASDELCIGRPVLFRTWRFLIRFVIPVTIAVILVNGLLG